jgi:hypothetical protein
MRVTRGEVVAIAGDLVTVALPADPDTGDVATVTGRIAPAVFVGGSAVVLTGEHGTTVLGPGAILPAYGRFTYAGDNAALAPPTGGVIVDPTGGQSRTVRISATDADGIGRNWAILAPGDNLTITDDPATPPVSGFARYVVTSPPVVTATDATFTADRTDTQGTQTPPPVGTVVRVYAALSGGGGSAPGPITVKFQTYEDLLNGITVGG